MIRDIAAALALLVAGPAAAVTYSFSTIEPFAGGLVAFTYDAPDFITTAGFVNASLFTTRSAGLQSVRFDPGCSLGGGNCAQISAFVQTSFGTASAVRYFAAGAFGTAGDYTAKFGSAATLGVVEAAAVPEPATWLMLLVGFSGVGAAARFAGRRELASSRARNGIVVAG